MFPRNTFAFPCNNSKGLGLGLLGRNAKVEEKKKKIPKMDP